MKKRDAQKDAKLQRKNKHQGGKASTPTCQATRRTSLGKAACASHELVHCAPRAHNKCASTKQASGKSASTNEFSRRNLSALPYLGHARSAGAGTIDAQWPWNPSFLSIKRTLTTRVDCCGMCCVRRVWVGGPVHTFGAPHTQYLMYPQGHFTFYQPQFVGAEHAHG